jgi:hypothetical protein
MLEAKKKEKSVPVLNAMKTYGEVNLKIHVILLPSKKLPVTFGEEAEWAPEPVWTT